MGCLQARDLHTRLGQDAGVSGRRLVLSGLRCSVCTPTLTLTLTLTFTPEVAPGPLVSGRCSPPCSAHTRPLSAARRPPRPSEYRKHRAAAELGDLVTHWLN